ncbi:hypothetical protein IP87_12445 [beta proteobacterium AAP121]|nr:hypothetical protein IP80_09710 [beta proteobacterium AAP65]KPF97182.1 hypothetical protein IP87_12445 [beta proteobacterium AAP121]
MILDHVTEVVHGDNKISEPFATRALDDVLQHRLTANRQQWFRAVLRVRTESDTLPAGHDYHGVASIRGLYQLVPEVQPHDFARLIDHGQLVQLVSTHQLQHHLALNLRRHNDGRTEYDRLHQAIQIQAAQQAASHVAVSQSAD